MKLDLRATSKEIFSVLLKDLGTFGGIGFYVAAILFFLVFGDFVYAGRLVLALLAVTAVVAVLRIAYAKPRPGAKKKRYDEIYQRIDNSSFPSIHVARAMMLSVGFYGFAPELLPFLAVMVIAVAASRIYFRRHDAVDIIVGAVIGFALGIALL